MTHQSQEIRLQILPLPSAYQPIVHEILTRLAFSVSFHASAHLAFVKCLLARLSVFFLTKDHVILLSFHLDGKDCLNQLTDF